ncbi:hypothetical protein DEU37_1617 [Microbacterium sp. AG790]|uniref:hypothetical protein n=1 Tax=Microbacterium sp. AG790 TaxID=2183995 RepID=UPI000EB01A85|nr:hypothetical protein [Microbacterium sp. AG790]RKS89304.1 hypothetical protein DEU37_1617 [Microbacterium sp. AG790]
MADPIWKNDPDEHDFPAAEDYLRLVADADRARSLVAALRTRATVVKKAKDILRAANLPLLPTDNPHVADDLRKVRAGKPLSPVLIVHGDLARGVPAQIADGYHRVCASWHLDENSEIPCRIVGPDATAA